MTVRNCMYCHIFALFISYNKWITGPYRSKLVEFNGRVLRNFELIFENISGKEYGNVIRGSSNIRFILQFVLDLKNYRGFELTRRQARVVCRYQYTKFNSYFKYRLDDSLTYRYCNYILSRFVECPGIEFIR